MFPGLFVKLQGSGSDRQADYITVISLLASYSWVTDGTPAESLSAALFVLNSILKVFWDLNKASAVGGGSTVMYLASPDPALMLLTSELSVLILFSVVNQF